MVSKRTIGLILVGALTLSGISCPKGYSEQNTSKSKIEQIEQIVDLRGGGTKGILMDTRVFSGYLGKRYLFIGQKNSSWIRAEEKVNNNSITYFLTGDGTAYFFDGQDYTKSPNQK
jgi:hypothetical protein